MDTPLTDTGETVVDTAHTGTGAECRVDALAKKVAQSAQTLGAHYEALRREFNQYEAPLRERAKGLADTVSERARAHPLATLGIAFAAGAILARALRR